MADPDDEKLRTLIAERLSKIEQRLQKTVLRGVDRQVIADYEAQDQAERQLWIKHAR